MPRKRIAIDFHPVSPWLVVFSRDPQWALQYLHSFILKIYVGYFYFIFFLVLPQGKNCISAFCTPLRGLARQLAEAKHCTLTQEEEMIFPEHAGSRIAQKSQPVQEEKLAQS